VSSIIGARIVLLLLLWFTKNIRTTLCDLLSGCLSDIHEYNRTPSELPGRLIVLSATSYLRVPALLSCCSSFWEPAVEKRSISAWSCKLCSCSLKIRSSHPSFAVSSCSLKRSLSNIICFAYHHLVSAFAPGYMLQCLWWMNPPWHDCD
jgi:hypothetical protein